MYLVVLGLYVFICDISGVCKVNFFFFCDLFLSLINFWFKKIRVKKFELYFYYFFFYDYRFEI